MFKNLVKNTLAVVGGLTLAATALDLAAEKKREKAAATDTVPGEPFHTVPKD